MFKQIPNTISILGQGGVAKSIMDCHEENLNKFEEPPHSVLTLKGGYPMICCPKDDSRPQNSIFSSETIRICTDDEIYDYYDDPDSVDCEPPLDDSPKFEYVYNSASNCPEGTKCTNGNTCGVKGITFHLFDKKFVTNILCSMKFQDSEFQN